eukprot:7075855-Lingulodinium_polyedra.AAC.1
MARSVRRAAPAAVLVWGMWLKSRASTTAAMKKLRTHLAATVATKKLRAGIALSAAEPWRRHHRSDAPPNHESA